MYTIVIDMSTVTYLLLPTMNAYWDRLEGVPRDARRQAWNKVLKAQLGHLVSCSFLDGYIDVPAAERNVILCWDRKDANFEYWRHKWLRGITDKLPVRKLRRRQRVFKSKDDVVGTLVSELPAQPIQYKEGRKLPDNSMKRLKAALVIMTHQFQVHQLGKVCYEVDDIMATIVKLNQTLHEPHHVILCCNDSDILGLVSDNVTYFDLGRQYKPIVRAGLAGLNAWRVNVKHLPPVDKPEEIWYEKAQFGDISDKLPACGESMVTLPAIDLFNPPVEHRLWECEEMSTAVLTALNNQARVYEVTEQANEVLNLAQVPKVFYNDRRTKQIPLRSNDVQN